MRQGYAKLHMPISDGTWVIIGDVTVDIGTIKCLATVGVNLDKLYEREDITLSLKDLTIVGVHPTEKATGEFAEKAFQQDIERLGGIEKVQAIVIDQGPDVTKGAKLLREANEQLKVIHDITHKLALVLEKDLKGNPQWDEYTELLAKTKKLVQQTEFAGVQPPNQRSKARFMNTALHIDWIGELQEKRRTGCLRDVAPERYDEYFGWTTRFLPLVDIWQQKVGVVEMIKATVRRHGLSEDVYNHLIAIFDQMPFDEVITAQDGFLCNALDAMYEEVEKLNDNQVLPASTEVLESLFGSYKNHTAKGGHGITGNILTIAALAGAPSTVDEICAVMEDTPIRKMLTWVENKIGNTLGKMRNLGAFKKTKIDIAFDGVPAFS